MNKSQLKSQVDKINSMSFNDLREELAECDNPVKEQLIRRLMKHKYEQHIEQLKLKQKQKKLKKDRKKKRKEASQNTLDNLDSLDDQNDDIINDLINEIDGMTNAEPETYVDEILDLIDDEQPQQYNQQQQHNQRNQRQDNSKGDKSDYYNNRMMDRLDADVYIKTVKDRKKVFVAPFSEVDDGKYALYHSSKRRR